MLPTGKIKRVLLSMLCGLLILVITWKYQNYDYTLKLEDEFFKKEFLIRDNVISRPPARGANFVFINTGKDLALVEDTVEYGNVAVSDREKIARFLQFVNAMEVKPEFTVIDIQFYFPYTVQPEADSILANEINKLGKVVIPILKGSKGIYKPPLYPAHYAHSDYRTFSTTFNKFRIMIQEDVQSIPLVMHEQIDKAKYHDHFLYPTCNGRLCLSAIWPTYYIKDADLKKNVVVEKLEDIRAVKNNITSPGKVTGEYFNIGEILFDLEANPENYARAFQNKVLIIGNFQEDVHTTPLGKMTGPVLLANIYLSLLNGEHIVNPWLLVLMFVSFTGLSYVALFEKMPQVNVNFKFLFSSHLTKFLKDYISYIGAMVLISLVAVIFFNVQIALFLPAAMFSGIEYIKNKKYKDLRK